MPFAVTWMSLQITLLSEVNRKRQIFYNITYSCKGSLGSSAGRESTCNAGDLGCIPGSGSSPGEGIGYPLQYSWASLVAQLVKNLPAMRETWVQSVGKMSWRREWQPLQHSCLENPHGQRSLAGYSPWGCKESDMTD